MSKYFIYLRGQPATGKITVARLLERELCWKVFWFHELKNTVYDIVKEHRIPRLMDELTSPIIRYILDKGENLIYVRPSPDKETIETVEHIIAEYPNYQSYVFRLTASYDTLVARANGRDDPYRISNQKDFDDYINSRNETDVTGEYAIDTTDLTPEQVTEQIISIVKAG